MYNNKLWYCKSLPFIFGKVYDFNSHITFSLTADTTESNQLPVSSAAASAVSSAEASAINMATPNRQINRQEIIDVSL